MDYNSILSEFPPLNLCFLYGSGIFHQEGYTEEDMKKTMLDIIISVNDPIKWHEENMKMNPKHYSFMKYMPNFLFKRISDCGTGIYFNALVKLNNGLSIKYGVISNNDLIDDLNDWKTLYLSGRLHKPVKFIKKDNKFNIPLKNNLIKGINTSLLLLPEKTNLEHFFITVSSLSYNGDIRMGIAENPHKVNNIVKGNYDRFKELYIPILKDNNNIEFNESTEDIYIKNDKENIKSLIKPLPNYIKNKIDLKNEKNDLYSIQNIISKELKRKVQIYSFSQSVKGVFTSGPIKSTIYLSRKIGKYLKRK